ncbi:unnamed protein product, partial [Rotaria sp. Silwood2]
MCGEVASQSAKLEQQIKHASLKDKSNYIDDLSTEINLKSSDLLHTNESSDSYYDEEFQDVLSDSKQLMLL